MAGISTINNTPNYLAIQQNQNLLNSFNKQSTGKQINTAADNPSGYAIATSLQVQAAGVNAATQNIQDAFNATQVASSAIQQISQISSQLRDLAVQGVNDFLSPTDRAALQAQANQLVQQANTIAQSVSFNGVQLINGSHAGAQAGTPATATVTNNDVVAQGGNVITQVAAANPNFQNANGAAQGFGGTATTNSTIQVQVVAGPNGTAQAVASVVDNQTGQVVQSGPVAAGGTITGFENVNIKVGNITAQDIGTTATIQIAQAVAPNTQNNALQVSNNANEGAITNVNLPGVSTSTLQISNINLGSSLSSTNAIGQLDNAISTLGNDQAQLGAQQVALQQQTKNNGLYANNLTASQSSIQDLNYGNETTNSTLAQIQSQITLGLISHNNVFAGSVLGLFQ